MTVREQRDHDRQNVAIEAVADALLAVCALQTGTDPGKALRRGFDALQTVYVRAEREANEQ